MIIRKFIILMLLVSYQMSPVFAADIAGIVYPDIREPYRSIFTSIMEGINDTLPKQAQLLSVSKETTPEDVSDWVKENHVGTLFALGSRSQKLTVDTDVKLKIAGAITRPIKNGFKQGVLLTPDPEKMVAYVSKLMPGIKRVFMVYSEDHSGWYLPLAQSATKKYGIELVGLLSQSKKNSIQIYNDILKNKATKNDALWLLQDPMSSDNKLILPLLLEQSWDRNIPVISNQPGHVERGVLFALYPDHFEIGVSMAQMSLDTTYIQPLKYIPFTTALTAANTRTADHLGLNWSRKTKRNFNLVFPKR